MQRLVWIRIATFVIWLLAAASVVYWVMQMQSGPSAPAAVQASAEQAAPVDVTALARGLGGGRPTAAIAAPAAPVQPSINISRFVLTGVVARAGSGGGARGGADGVALLAVDGKPARPYSVGAVIVDNIQLHAVSPGKASLAIKAAQSNNENAARTEPVVLELPKLTTAIVGSTAPLRPVLPPPQMGQPPGAAPAASPGLVPNVSVTGMPQLNTSIVNPAGGPTSGRMPPPKATAESATR
jgi:general secretion pathway protein C